MARRTKAEVEEAVQSLRETLKPGDEVWCILRHVSRSGMSRVIELVIPGECRWTDRHGKKRKTMRPLFLGYNAAIALGRPYNEKHGGVRMDGCGMDMGFALVYDLAAVLFGDGYKLSHRWV